jgi:hypothetical protein
LRATSWLDVVKRLKNERPPKNVNESPSKPPKNARPHNNG